MLVKVTKNGCIMVHRIPGMAFVLIMIVSKSLEMKVQNITLISIKNFSHRQIVYAVRPRPPFFITSI